MSIVGTRPPLISETNLYELHHRARLAIKPGITGMWQVSGRSDITDFEEGVRLDREYISNWNIGLDGKYEHRCKEEPTMDQELFNPQSSSVTSSRILYTPSTFARTSLLHLQEVGSLQAIHPHTSTRTNLTSFLCFIVLSGNGTLTYEGTTYELSAGDCVFIDCRKAYSHSTGHSTDGNNTSISTPTCVNESACEKDTAASKSTNPPTSLWSLQWCHFYAPFLPAIYEKYKERGGSPVFHPDDSSPFTAILTDLYSLASSSDYIRDIVHFGSDPMKYR